MPGDGGGLAGKGGVLLGVGGSGFSRLYEEEGGEGAFPRRQIGGGGGGGAEEECFMLPEGEDLNEWIAVNSEHQLLLVNCRSTVHDDACVSLVFLSG